MVTPAFHAVLRHLRQRAAAPAAQEPSDRELLRQVVAHADERAFAARLGRHGAMVLGVCRSVLRRPDDAEDLFQATFLVLARRAGAIRQQASVASWLHGVAYRLARKQNVREAQRRCREARVPPRPAAVAMDDLTWRELRGVLHEEVARLPERFRLPLLLCYWEGLTQDEAARRLGWTKATVKERLARARELLRGRLTRRGLTLSAP